MGPRCATRALPAPFSATLSQALSVYLRECGASVSASGQTACPIRPTLRQSQSCHSHTSPLRPGWPSPPLLPVWMNVYFLFTWCRTCRSIFRQFWSCEEAQCVHLSHHLGSPSDFYILMEDEKPVSNCGISSISVPVKEIKNYTMKIVYSICIKTVL